MKYDVVIIGGGVSALMNAYHLNKAKLSVLVVDKDSDNIKNKTSYGNAGLLSAFSKTPLSHPGILMDTLKLLLTKKSPIYFSSFPDIKMIIWSLKFFLSVSQKKTEETMRLFEKFGEKSFFHYNHMQNVLNLDFEYKRKGFASIYTNQAKFKRAKKMYANNKNIKEISLDELKQICPMIDAKKISGSFILDKNSQINPEKVIKNLTTYLCNNGVNFAKNEQIVDLQKDGAKISCAISATNKQYFGDNFIMATGANEALCKKLGTTLMQIPTKGYSLTIKTNDKLKQITKLPIMIADKFTILTPRKEDIRITSKLEIGTKDKNIDPQKINDLLLSVKDIFTKEFDLEDAQMQPWAGFRALTPNDRPLIGRDNNYKNFFYSTGLGWLGMTFGPAIGEAVSDLIIKDMQNNQSEDIRLFSGLVS